MKTAGFSLVEVVIALGLFAFCIVVILGLMVTGLRSARGVADETVAVNMAESILGAWQVQASKSNELTIPGLISNLPPLTQSGSRDFYFGGEGIQVANSEPASVYMRYTTLPAPSKTSTVVTLDFRWPARGPTNTAQTRQITGAVAVPVP